MCIRDRAGGDDGASSGCTRPLVASCDPSAGDPSRLDDASGQPSTIGSDPRPVSTRPTATPASFTINPASSVTFCAPRASASSSTRTSPPGRDVDVASSSCNCCCTSMRRARMAARACSSAFVSSKLRRTCPRMNAYRYVSRQNICPASLCARDRCGV